LTSTRKNLASTVGARMLARLMGRDLWNMRSGTVPSFCTRIW
jgi:hypothetical protein